MKRTNLLLGILLGVQVVFFGLVYAFSGGSGETQATRRLLLAGVERQAVQKITIADNDGKKVTVARQGDKWVLPERANHPADSKKVDRILGQLLGLESVYLVSRSPAHHHEFEVAADKFRRQVTLEGKAGLTRQIFVGKAGSSGFTNVRLASGPEIYAVEDLKYWELGTRIADWAQKKVVDEDSKRVAKLEITKGDKHYLLERNTQDQWRMDGQPVKKVEANTLAGKAVQLDMSDILGLRDDAEVKKKLAAGKDEMTVTVSLASDPLPAKTKEQSVPGQGGEQQPEPGKEQQPAAPIINQTIVLHLWKHPEKDNILYLVREDSQYAYQVDKWRVSKFIDFDPDKIVDKSQSPGPKKNTPQGKQTAKQATKKVAKKK